MCKKKSPGLFKNVIYKMFLEIIYLIYIYKKDLVLNNQQWLICHKTKQNHNSFPLQRASNVHIWMQICYRNLEKIVKSYFFCAIHIWWFTFIFQMNDDFCRVCFRSKRHFLLIQIFNIILIRILSFQNRSFAARVNGSYKRSLTVRRIV